MKMRFLLVIALSAAACSAQNAGSSRTVLTNRDIVTLADAGFGEEFIVEMIGTSRPEFDTAADAIADLKKHGVKEDIIRAMRTARPSGSSSTTPEFGGGRAQPIRVFVQAGPSEAHSQTAGIVAAFAHNCPAMTITSRKEAAAYLVVLERTAGKLLRRATARMVVFDRAGDTVYGSELPLAKALRGFCTSAQSLVAAKADESQPDSRFFAR